MAEERNPDEYSVRDLVVGVVRRAYTELAEVTVNVDPHVPQEERKRSLYLYFQTMRHLFFRLYVLVNVASGDNEFVESGMGIQHMHSKLRICFEQMQTHMGLVADKFFDLGPVDGDFLGKLWSARQGPWDVGSALDVLGPTHSYTSMPQALQHVFHPKHQSFTSPETQQLWAATVRQRALMAEQSLPTESTIKMSWAASGILRIGRLGCYELYVTAFEPDRDSTWVLLRVAFYGAKRGSKHQLQRTHEILQRCLQNGGSLADVIEFVDKLWKRWIHHYWLTELRAAFKGTGVRLMELGGDSGGVAVSWSVDDSVVLHVVPLSYVAANRLNESSRFHGMRIQDAVGGDEICVERAIAHVLGFNARRTKIPIYDRVLLCPGDESVDEAACIVDKLFGQGAETDIVALVYAVKRELTLIRVQRMWSILRRLSAEVVEWNDLETPPLRISIGPSLEVSVNVTGDPVEAAPFRMPTSLQLSVRSSLVDRVDQLQLRPSERNNGCDCSCRTNATALPPLLSPENPSYMRVWLKHVVTLLRVGRLNECLQSGGLKSRLETKADLLDMYPSGTDAEESSQEAPLEDVSSRIVCLVPVSADAGMEVSIYCGADGEWKTSVMVGPSATSYELPESIASALASSLQQMVTTASSASSLQRVLAQVMCTYSVYVIVDALRDAGVSVVLDRQKTKAIFRLPIRVGDASEQKGWNNPSYGWFEAEFVHDAESSPSWKVSNVNSLSEFAGKQFTWVLQYPRETDAQIVLSRLRAWVALFSLHQLWSTSCPGHIDMELLSDSLIIRGVENGDSVRYDPPITISYDQKTRSFVVEKGLSDCLIRHVERCILRESPDICYAMLKTRIHPMHVIVSGLRGACNLGPSAELSVHISAPHTIRVQMPMAVIPSLPQVHNYPWSSKLQIDIRLTGSNGLQVFIEDPNSALPNSQAMRYNLLRVAGCQGADVFPRLAAVVGKWLAHLRLFQETCAMAIQSVPVAQRSAFATRVIDSLSVELSDSSSTQTGVFSIHDDSSLRFAMRIVPPVVQEFVDRYFINTPDETSLPRIRAFSRALVTPSLWQSFVSHLENKSGMYSLGATGGGSLFPV